MWREQTRRRRILCSLFCTLNAGTNDHRCSLSMIVIDYRYRLSLPLRRLQRAGAGSVERDALCEAETVLEVQGYICALPYSPDYKTHFIPLHFNTSVRVRRDMRKSFDTASRPTSWRRGPFHNEAARRRPHRVAQAQRRRFVKARLGRFLFLSLLCQGTHRIDMGNIQGKVPLGRVQIVYVLETCHWVGLFGVHFAKISLYKCASRLGTKQQWAGGRDGYMFEVHFTNVPLAWLQEHGATNSETEREREKRAPLRVAPQSLSSPTRRAHTWELLAWLAGPTLLPAVATAAAAAAVAG